MPRPVVSTSTASGAATIGLCSRLASRSSRSRRSSTEISRRRAEQLGADYGLILVEQRIRDERDRSREHSPLLPAQDAVELDTPGLSLDEVVERIVELAR